MRTTAILIVMLLAGLLAGTASAAPRTVTDPQAPRALNDDGPVQVQWTDPAQFTEIRHSPNPRDAQSRHWARVLAHHTQKQALKQLPACSQSRRVA